MEPATVVMLASKATEHGATFLGEDLVGWRTALIAAVPAAIIYEVAMALARKVTLRLPFLVLYAARIGVSRDDWQRVYAEWKAELWFILRDRDMHWLTRFVTGMRFAIPLALGGARETVKAEAKPRRRTLQEFTPDSRTLLFRTMVTSVASGGTFVMAYVLRLTPMESWTVSIGVGALIIGLQYWRMRSRDEDGFPDHLM